MSAPVVGVVRGGRRPWVGRTYAHLVLPTAQLNEELRSVLDKAMGSLGLQAVDTDAEASMFARRWGDGTGPALLLTVLGWYPLLVTVGPESGAPARLRRAKERLVDTVLAQDGHVVSDRDLDRVMSACRERWASAVAARQRIEEQRIWLESRRCSTCGTWSSYGVLHCRQCSRRFSPADDADRDQRGRAAEEIVGAAAHELESLASGAGLFPEWPVRHDG